MQRSKVNDGRGHQFVGINKVMVSTICHGTLKKSHKIIYVPSPDSNAGLLGDRRTLYHVAIKAGLYRKAVQVYDIPNYHIPCDILPHQIRLRPRISAYRNKLEELLHRDQAGFYVGRHLSRTLKKSPCPGRGSNRGPFNLEASTLPRRY